MAIPTITMNNGLKVPSFGLGTLQGAPGEVEKAIKYAIECGYRHIDCAYIYGNEKEIGNAIKNAIQEGIVKREDLFIVTKLWNTFHNIELVIPALKVSLERLQLDYLDLFLVHWPFGYKEGAKGLFPNCDDAHIEFSGVDFVDTWKGMEKCVELGLTKSIGISNFNSKQIERLLNIAKIMPVMHQIEVHPQLNNKKLIDFCKAEGIAITAYSPLGSPTRTWQKPGDPELDLDDPKIKKIAQKYNKTTSQVILRYVYDLGTIPIPKSVNKNRIVENIDIFDFKLMPEDMDIMDSMECNGRVCPAGGVEGHMYYPFHLEY